MRFVSTVAAVGALTFAASTAFAGWTAKQSHTMGDKGGKQMSQMAYGHHKLRVDNPDQTTIIIDLLSGDFTMVDHGKKQFASVTLEELVKMQNEMIAQMRAQLPNMPENVRKTIEAQLEKQEKARKADLSVKKTGKKDKVAGRTCQIYTWEGPEGEVEACMSAKVDVDVSAFRNDAKKLAAKLKKAGVGAGAASMVLLQVADYGFPLRTKRTMMLGPQAIASTTEVQEMKKDNAPASNFTAPKAYKKLGFKEMMMQGAPGGGAGGPPRR
ncbi:MAG: DUF4412 domain-containing protein [Deltaproteobacteria bacterium]|jgi:hypothetical protein